MFLNTILEASDFLSFINGRASASIIKQLNRKFKEAALNITYEQWSILTSLWIKNGQTQQSISDYVCKDKASVTRLIDQLEKNNLVKRDADLNDRRINLIHLTNEGKHLERIANDIVEHSFNLSTWNISKEEFTTVVRVFKKIISNVENIDNIKLEK